MCLCVRTKKLIVDVIRIQPGETLSEILETPASAPQVILSLSFDRFLLRYASVPKHIRTLTVICNAFVSLFLKESEHVKIIERRAVQDAQTPEGLKSSPAVLEDSQLPLEQKKRKILRNLRNLEQAGLVTASNKYQDVINDISKAHTPLLIH